MFNRDFEFVIIKDIENARLAAYEKGCKAFAFTNGPTGSIEVRTGVVNYYTYYVHKHNTMIKYYKKYLTIFGGQIVWEKNGKTENETIVFPTRLEYASLIR